MNEPRHPITERARDLRRRSTSSEQLLWEHLRARRFRGLKFRRQQPIGGRFILDFYCAEMKLGIEIDGGVHRDRAREDKQRDRALAEAGIRIVRLDVDQLHGDIQALLESLIPSRTSESEAPLHKDGEGLG